MDTRDIVIGSGLAALGAVIGLAASERVLVLAGPAQGGFTHYRTGGGDVPSSYLGDGGLGNHWHGVIPTGWRNNFGRGDAAGFAALFAHFYPRADPRPLLGAPWLFVPWKPIRPRPEFARLRRLRGERLRVVADSARRFRFDERGVEVETANGQVHRARRLWVAAGALHTPALLEHSLGPRLARGLVSDHVMGYVGQADGLAPPAIRHGRHGAFFPAHMAAGADALYTLRPARFGFRTLDHGVEQRAAFGLPTGGAVAKIAKRMSPGLLVEAFYNRFGLFAASPRHSIYLQALAPDAYALAGDAASLVARDAVIAAAVEAARQLQPFGAGVRLSRRPELIIPGIHLHHSVDVDALRRTGVDVPGSPVQVVDASTLHDIGPEHHSFKMMLAAHDRAQRALQG